MALWITKGFHFLGRRFRFGGFSFAAVLLFRRGCARFERNLDDQPGGMDMEVHERLIFLRTGRWGSDTIPARLFGNNQERRRFLKGLAARVPCEPLLWFLYHYIWCLGFLEGRPGLIASRLRSDYIAQVRAKVYELCLQDRQGHAEAPSKFGDTWTA